MSRSPRKNKEIVEYLRKEIADLTKENQKLKIQLYRCQESLDVFHKKHIRDNVKYSYNKDEDDFI